ncbi:hypothetical protein FJT64_021975 [Amphibalanus amphitrite]|uniref:DUF985 domain-containing protein n=1 Tax=Amphibalanus amphitrite TaxID=1232801 RepID=A0A6A4WWN9_AMPAM|nr:uncharacterized protein LOC122382613 [Amphibalanus amphitrite]KAF0306531.1 hypothetical protein FJT64_021975 [Amphibalanus amphitrite]
MEPRRTAAARALLPLLVLESLVLVSGAAVAPEVMAEEAPVCESATAHSHATCEAEFEYLVQRFNMTRTPANTYFAPVFSSSQLNADGQPVTNTIMELQPAGTRIPWLRTNVATQLFLWHHRGAALAIHALLPSGEYTREVLGDPLRHPGAQFQLAMPYMTWVSTEVLSDTEYVLMSGSAVPSFSRLDYDLANPVELVAEFPKHEAVIMAAYDKAASN